MNFKKPLLIPKLICASLLFTIIFAACKKDFDREPVQVAALGFIHASPGTGALDFIIDNQRAGRFNYTKDLGYYAAFPGTRLIGVAKKDSLKYLDTAVVNLVSGKSYSAFIIDTLKKTNIWVVEDDLSAPETDKAKIRFINLSPSSVPFDLIFNGNINEDVAPLFTNKPFKEKTDFISINPKDDYTIHLREAGSTNVVATLATKIEKGKIYTIWAKGLKTATDSTALDLSILSHN